MSRQTWPEGHGENFCFAAFTAGLCFLRLSQPPLLCEAISHHCDEGACSKLWLILVRSGEWSGTAKSSKNYNFSSSSPRFGPNSPRVPPKIGKFIACQLVIHPSWQKKSQPPAPPVTGPESGVTKEIPRRGNRRTGKASALIDKRDPWKWFENQWVSLGLCSTPGM